MNAFQGCAIPQAIDAPSTLTDAEILDADQEKHEEGDPALWLVLKESDARRIVSACENGQAFVAIEILKNQPWWSELSAAVRGLRYRRTKIVS